MRNLKYFTKSRERMEYKKSINAWKKLSFEPFAFIKLNLEDAHREILRRNHSMLVREMPPELVAEKL